ncbi:hypothetical protein ABIE52_000024 [Rhodococcus sp. OAS809]
MRAHVNSSKTDVTIWGSLYQKHFTNWAATERAATMVATATPLK